jgi:diguanylate cyclase (GGDEF)-like protein
MTSKTSVWGSRGAVGRSAAVLAATWVLGVLAIGVVFQFEREVDETRRAQILISQMRNQEGQVLAIAFRPATAASTDPAADQAQTRIEMAQAMGVFDNSLSTLKRLGHSDAPTHIEALIQTDYRLLNRFASLVGRGESQQAAFQLGKSERRGGVRAELAAAFDQADAGYGANAASSRTVALIGSALSIAFLLVAFSLTFHHSARARRRSHDDATTDALTGLGNRRKLFGDLERAVASLEGAQTLTLGILDLDGFKAYNDTFGHPAGDALLSRLGHRLTAAVGNDADPYRIGGDEFVIVTGATDGERLMSAAQSALSEKGAGFSIGCSRGSTRIHAGVTPEQALHVADQRLYANKRSVRGGQTEAKDALLQVLAEQDTGLVNHLAHVAQLAESTAIRLGLPGEQVKRARLAAELHDVGKAAIPAAILDKPGPLDAAERSLMQRHTLIGERILAAAPTLEAIAPIVRSAHERHDGNGYPDGLCREEIPICSRIIAVVDAYAAMTTDRPYRKAMPAATALAGLHMNAGTQFDPAVVEAFAHELTSPFRSAEPLPVVPKVAA